jgi:hypothetical protein
MVLIRRAVISLQASSTTLHSVVFFHRLIRHRVASACACMNASAHNGAVQFGSFIHVHPSIDPRERKKKEQITETHAHNTTNKPPNPTD